MNVYDFDGTLYRGDSTVDFYLFALRRRPSLVRYLPKQALGFLLHGLGRIDRTRLKEYFFSFLPGLDAQQLAEDFWDAHQGRIFPWYPAQHREDDLVISASPEFLLRPICRRLGIKELIASQVDPATGLFRGKNCRGQEKVAQFQALYGDVPIADFYSDSNADLPLARLASRAFLVSDGTIKQWEL